MPLHEDFKKILNSMIKKYGKKKGTQVFYSWVNKNKLDDTKPMPKHIKGEDMEAKKKSMGFEVNYVTGIDKIEIIAEEKEVAGATVKYEKVLLHGTLMDAIENKNSWKAHPPSMSAYADSVPRAAVKVQHEYDDRKIIGSGLSGVYIEGDNLVNYSLEIANQEAVAKFKTGEWNTRILGVSPNIKGYTKAECSICGKDVRECGHTMGQVYKGTKCVVTPIGGYVSEISLTSEPAYFPRAGTIDHMSFAASLMESLNMEEQNMTDITSEIKEKDTKIEELSAQLEEQKTKIAVLEKKIKAEEEAGDDKPEDKPDESAEPESTEPEGDGDEKKEEVVAMKKENDDLKAELKKVKDVTREAELAKIVESKEVIASILKKDYSDEDFKSELELIKELKVNKTGSAPLEAGKKKEPDEEFKEMFGASKKDFVKEIIVGPAEQSEIKELLGD